jgi:hypothetical protein
LINEGGVNKMYYGIQDFDSTKDSLVHLEMETGIYIKCVFFKINKIYFVETRRYCFLSSTFDSWQWNE